MQVQSRNIRNAIVAIAQTCIFVLVVALSFLQVGDSDEYLLEGIDGPFTDKLFRTRNRFFTKDQPVSQEITLIGIDDHTNRELAPYGKEVWVPRKPFIDQIQYLKDYYKPRVVAYDIIFQQSSTENDVTEEGVLWGDKPDIYKNILKTVSDNSEGNIILSEHLLPLSQMSTLSTWSAEQIFAEQFGELTQSGTSSVLACYFSDDPNTQENNWREINILGSDPDDLHEDNGLLAPDLKMSSIPEEFVTQIPDDYNFLMHKPTVPGTRFREYCTLAPINVPRDRDGIVRRYPLLMGMQYSFVDPATKETVTRRLFLPTMAFQACLLHWGIDLRSFRRLPDYYKNGRPIIDVIMGDRIKVQKGDGFEVTIPIDSKGRILLDYVGSINRFESLSFVSTLGFYQDLFKMLRNKLVMVGITATGGTDSGPTPIDEITPYVHVHMVAASNMLTETFIQPLSTKRKLLIMFVLWLVLTPMVFVDARVYTGLIVLSSIVYCGVIYIGIHTHSYTFPIIGPFLYIGSSFFAALFIHYLTEERERKKIRGMFQTMVSGEVLNYMETHPESFSLEGQARDATIMFSDVAGFTTISESLTAEDLVRLLNAYLTPMTDIIQEHQGYVDKYEGDAIMAEWGVPYKNEQHEVLACYAALEQQRKLAEIRPRLQARFGHEMNVRMGVNSGRVSAGNMGSEKRFSYTVMGDAVNQAARFEPANKDYGTAIMIGETTYQGAKNEIEARLLDKIIVKGKTKPIRVYELLSRKGELSDELRQVASIYVEALEIHWKRNFVGALRLLEEALVILPEDGPCNALKLRIEGYLQHPPPESWQGEYIRATKD